MKLVRTVVSCLILNMELNMMLILLISLWSLHALGIPEPYDR